MIIGNKNHFHFSRKRVEIILVRLSEAILIRQQEQLVRHVKRVSHQHSLQCFKTQTQELMKLRVLIKLANLMQIQMVVVKIKYLTLTDISNLNFGFFAISNLNHTFLTISDAALRRLSSRSSSYASTASRKSLQ